MSDSEENVVISSLPADANGEKLEPEQQVAKRVIDAAAPLAHGGEETKLSIPLSIEQYMSAGELAQTVRDPCGECRYFNRTAWHAVVRCASATHEGRKHLNGVRAMLIATQNFAMQDLHTGPDGDFDTDNALNSLGRCGVLSEMANDDVAVHPLGVCPPQLRSPEKPRGEFIPRSIDDERAGSAAFDNVMRAAQGRIL